MTRRKRGRKVAEWPPEPLKVALTVRTEDEILALRARIGALETALEAAQAAYNQVEFRFRCETMVNAQLVDLCREAGVKYRDSLLARPYQQPEETGGENDGR